MLTFYIKNIESEEQEMTRKLKGLFIAVMALMLVACNSAGDKSQNTSGNAETDTEFRPALSGQPPTLDPVMTAASSTRYTARHIFEQLLTINSNFQPVPMLAESVDMSEDGKTYTFILREGVKFHNDKEMKY